MSIFLLPIFPTSDCCFAFCVCCVLEAVHHIEKKGKGELIHLSPQDIYNNLIKHEVENEDGRTVADTIKWVRENGCVLETSCPYVGTFKQAAKERNVLTLIFSFHSIQTNFFIIIFTSIIHINLFLH